MDTSVVIISCDKNKDIHEPFYKLYSKYWKHNFKTYIVMEEQNCEYFNTIKVKGSWTSRVRQALEQIDTKYVIFLLDDFFFHNKVDNNKIIEILKSYDDNTAVYNLELSNHTKDTKKSLNGFIKRNNKEPYLNSCQPSIHDRIKLIERLKEDKTPWEWELTEVDSKYDFYINNKELIFDIGYNETKKPWCLVQGKWSIETKNLFEKENIKVDYSKRGFIDYDLSIIIPYYKTKELTIELLDNLTKQLKPNVEIILIDDGCNEKAFDKYPIKVIHQENSGVSSARNKGIDICKGYNVVFIDSDDNVSENYIDKILNKINKNEFDYCYFSWKSIGVTKEDFIINDKPPEWNTSVWNCIYKRDLIGNIRFNENKTMSEDTEFNEKVLKGKKENITDILYYYHNGRENSLTSRYRNNEITMNETIKSQIIVYRSYTSKIGGVETAIYNMCNLLRDKYEIMFVYDNADPIQLNRLKKLVKCVKFIGQNFKSDLFLIYSFNDCTILNNVVSKEFIQHICCNVEELSQPYIKHDKITKFTSDSIAGAKAFKRKFGIECDLLHNLFDCTEPKKVLNLMSATRLSSEKGYYRMKALAKRMNERGLLFEWTVFTNDLPDEIIDGFVFREPRLNVVDYMWNKDYILQLSDSENWGCTITESLDRNVPVVVTDFNSAYEQVEDKVNGFILKRDLSNLDEVIDNMYSKDLKGYKHIKKYNVSEWLYLLKNLKETKSNYVYNPEEIEVDTYNTYITLALVRDEQGNQIEPNNEINIRNISRVRELLRFNLIKRKEL